MKCQECGKEFKSLISHIYYKHEWSVSQYRHMYNIPSSTPLYDKDCYKRLSKEEIAKRLKEFKDSIT